MPTDTTLKHTLTLEQISQELRRSEDHPSVRDVLDAIKAGERAVQRAVAEREAARAERHAARQSAAFDNRDEKRLSSADAKLKQSEQECHIAEMRLESARERYMPTLTAASLQVEKTVQDAQTAKAIDFEGIMDRAARVNEEIRQLEELSERLFPGADRARRGLAGRPLVRLSWREFAKDGRFALWKQAWRRMAAYTPSLPQGEPRVNVRFLKSADTGPVLTGGGYNAGEVAGFTPRKAEQLIAQGIAERVS